ncbi:unnamed protein product [Citrullus colocynthis]|uniref:DUF4283 domain-containing protein n=1 Tax=Citrullus colocynthis TaxID=252529 RepID=A0ABP0XTF6_9ROSI
MNRRANFEAFKSVMKNVGKVLATKCSEAGISSFVFQVYGLWTFDLLVLTTTPSENEQLVDLKFSLASFWLNFHNVPVSYITREMNKIKKKKREKKKKRANQIFSAPPPAGGGKLKTWTQHLKLLR